MIPSGKLLLITPAFHKYWRGMQRALESQGFDVQAYEYDLLTSPREKARNKIKYEFAERIGRRGAVRQAADLTASVMDVVEAAAPERVIVIKGDIFLPEFWEHLKRRSIPTVVWMYDELRRTHYATRGLPDVDGIASYSAHDAAAIAADGHNALHLPLFYASAGTLEPRISNEVTFIGARYGARQPTLEYLQERGIPVRAYGRDWSHAAVDRLRTWGWERPNIPAGRDVGLHEAHNIMAGSLGTLNIHGDQDGFTIRTFEACGVGALQFIDRADVADLYEPGTELLVYESLEHLEELVRRAQVDTAWTDRIRAAARARTLREHTVEHRMEELVKLWG